MQPLRQCIPRRQLREVVRRTRHRLDLVDVDRLEERLACREMPVERPDPDLRPFGNVFERRRRAVLGEDRARRRHELVVVPARIGALRALQLDIGLTHRI